MTVFPQPASDPRQAGAPDPLLELRDFGVSFPGRDGPVDVVRGIDLTLSPERRSASSANPAAARA